MNGQPEWKYAFIAARDGRVMGECLNEPWSERTELWLLSMEKAGNLVMGYWTKEAYLAARNA